MLTRAVKFPVSFIANAASRNVEGHRATFVYLVFALVKCSKHVDSLASRRVWLAVNMCGESPGTTPAEYT